VTSEELNCFWRANVDLVLLCSVVHGRVRFDVAGVAVCAVGAPGAAVVGHQSQGVFAEPSYAIWDYGSHSWRSLIRFHSRRWT
jgi:hypothetical protein